MRKQHHRVRSPRLRVEPLEARAVPAGDVAAFLLRGDLIVLGDGAGNDVEVVLADGNLVVQGRAGTGTTVNGGARTVFEGVGGIADDLFVSLGGGGDRLDVVGVKVGGDATVLADAAFADFFGGGDDQVLLQSLAVAGNLTVSAGGGADQVLLARSTVAGDTRVVTGGGADRFALVRSTLNGRLTADTGGGADRVFLDPAAAGGAVQVRTGGGADEVVLHGANTYAGPVTLDGGGGRDRTELDAAAVFRAGLRLRGFETVDQVEVTEFSAAEGLAVRGIPFGDPPGTGAQTFSRNGAGFSGGEVTFTGIPAAYASAPTTYIAGPGGATITFEAPAEQVRFFFVHFPGAAVGTATAYDEAGNVVAAVSSTQTTFIGDPANFVTLSGDRPISRVVVTGGMIDNVSFVR